MLAYLKNAGILAALIIIQKTLISFIAVTDFYVTPDIVLIGVVYLGIRNGKIYGSLSGFFAGLVVDFISFSFLGLMALAKASAGFISGYFSTDQNKIERYLGSYVFVIIVIICSLLNNVIYFTIYFQGGTLQFTDILIRYVVPTSVYTALFATIPIIFEKRKKVR